ncbi:potassium channel family protein [Algibacter mikhailovii]|uniref:potassium channel family protein n=1 Tax=Algibacter mikhailovii TaxID=425498 RepID=UPI002494E20B|nr:potassium channel family protein [Algibacter mikhailovii]
MNKIYGKLHDLRYGLFFCSQLAILFGSLIMPIALYDSVIMPILFMLNILFGLLLTSKNKRLTQAFAILFLILIVIFGFNLIKKSESNLLSFIRFGVYFVFYIFVTIEIIKQVLKTKSVSKNVITGLMSGYISMGFLAFFMFTSIEIAVPGSFKGLLPAGGTFLNKVDALLYYSYITLLTIGYGDIVPLTDVARKSSFFVGILGQFYIIIVTTVVVEKYIYNSRNRK